MLTLAPKAALDIELGWLSNPEDIGRLTDSASLRRLAQAIADGVYEFLKPQIQAVGK
jgi:N-acetylmuramoyl-L-alanine amidase